VKGSEEVLVHRPGVRDQFGQVGTVTAPRAVQGCILWPRSTTEGDTIREDTSIVVVNLFVPPGADLLPTDTVTARGKEWTVEGDAEEYLMHGRTRGRIFTLRRAA
jgi:hypothetical protein